MQMRQETVKSGFQHSLHADVPGCSWQCTYHQLKIKQIWNAGSIKTYWPVCWSSNVKEYDLHKTRAPEVGSEVSKKQGGKYS